MNKKEIRLKCVEMANKTAEKVGLEFTGSDNEPYLLRAEDIYKYVTEENADTEFRLKCAEIALKTVTKRGFMHSLLFKKIEQVEKFVLEETVSEPKREEKAEEPPAEKAEEVPADENPASKRKKRKQPKGE